MAATNTGDYGLDLQNLADTQRAYLKQTGASAQGRVNDQSNLAYETAVNRMSAKNKQGNGAASSRGLLYSGLNEQNQANNAQAAQNETDQGRTQANLDEYNLEQSLQGNAATSYQNAYRTAIARNQMKNSQQLGDAARDQQGAANLAGGAFSLGGKLISGGVF